MVQIEIVDYRSLASKLLNTGVFILDDTGRIIDNCEYIYRESDNTPLTELVSSGIRINDTFIAGRPNFEFTGGDLLTNKFSFFTPGFDNLLSIVSDVISLKQYEISLDSRFFSNPLVADSKRGVFGDDVKDLIDLSLYDIMKLRFKDTLTPEAYQELAVLTRSLLKNIDSLVIKNMGKVLRTELSDDGTYITITHEYTIEHYLYIDALDQLDIVEEIESMSTGFDMVEEDEDIGTEELYQDKIGTGETIIVPIKMDASDSFKVSTSSKAFYHGMDTDGGGVIEFLFTLQSNSYIVINTSNDGVPFNIVVYSINGNLNNTVFYGIGLQEAIDKIDLQVFPKKLYYKTPKRNISTTTDIVSVITELDEVTDAGRLAVKKAKEELIAANLASLKKEKQEEFKNYKDLTNSVVKLNKGFRYFKEVKEG